MKSHLFNEASDLESQLVKDVLEALQEGIILRGSASILFSGGSTPKKMLESLAAAPFDWRNVKVGLVDDRMVPKTSSASNANLLHAHFLDRIRGEAPKFYPLVEWEDESQNIDAAMQSVEAIGKPDVVVLGMGTDGHTASFFPGGDNLEAATSPTTNRLFLSMLAPGAQEPRITMTLPCLTSARNLFLHIEGEEKLRVYEEALEDGPADDLPIRHVLRHPDVNLHVYWAP